MGSKNRHRESSRSDEASAASLQPLAVTPDERHEMIAVAAYFLAERRGFAVADPVKDWWEAAADIDSMLENMGNAGVTSAEYERVGLRNALRFWAK